MQRQIDHRLSNTRRVQTTVLPRDIKQILSDINHDASTHTTLSPSITTNRWKRKRRKIILERVYQPPSTQGVDTDTSGVQIIPAQDQQSYDHNGTAFLGSPDTEYRQGFLSSRSPLPHHASPDSPDVEVGRHRRTPLSDRHSSSTLYYKDDFKMDSNSVPTSLQGDLSDRSNGLVSLLDNTGENPDSIELAYLGLEVQNTMDIAKCTIDASIIRSVHLLVISDIEQLDVLGNIDPRLLVLSATPIYLSSFYEHTRSRSLTIRLQKSYPFPQTTSINRHFRTAPRNFPGLRMQLFENY